MRESNTLACTKQAAKAAVAAMTRPEGMSKVTWRGVHRLLEAIARCYPTAYPSQLTLAARLDVDVRTVKRYVAAAVAANLLVVTPDAGAAPRRKHGSKTNRYHLTHGDKMAHQESHYSYGVVPVTPSQETSSPVPSSCSPSGLADPPTRPTVVVMRDWDDERSRDVGPPAAPPLRSKRRVRPAASEIVSDIDSQRRKRKRPPKPPPQSRRLAEYFAVIWQQMQMETGRHKDTRGLESIGQAKVYIEAHFKDRTELEVRKMMEEFVIAVRKRDVTIKSGQSGWMCFTGAWGRQRHVVTGDPYAAYRKENQK